MNDYLSSINNWSLNHHFIINHEEDGPNFHIMSELLKSPKMDLEAKLRYINDLDHDILQQEIEIMNGIMVKNHWFNPLKVQIEKSYQITNQSLLYKQIQSVTDLDHFNKDTDNYFKNIFSEYIKEAKKTYTKSHSKLDSILNKFWKELNQIKSPNNDIKKITDSLKRLNINPCNNLDLLPNFTCTNCDENRNQDYQKHKTNSKFNQ